MKKILLAGLMAGTSLYSTSAAAQSGELEELRAQIAAMQAQVERLAAHVAELEAEQVQQEQATAQVVATQAETSAQIAAVSEAKSDTSISWKGAPLIEGKGGWSFKPRGRLQVDAGFVSVPEETGREDGFGSELRRARLGVEGDIPGGFGYKFEVDVAGNEVELADGIITYEDGDLKASAGQHNNFQSLEELTSSRFTSFIERAAFTDAFGFERRLGVSAQYGAGPVLVQAGIFSDNIADLPGKSWSADGRIVFAPEMGNTQLHLGGSIHYAELAAGDTVRYRQRPLVHFTGERFVNTGSFAATSETGYGLEAAAISGPFHVAGEAFWQQANQPGLLESADFFGGYAEAGVFLTNGDKRGYKGGTFDRVKPANPVNNGGMGAVQLNLRYDYLDLVDGPIVGGTQNGYYASLVWTPTDYTRLLLNYGRLDYDRAVYTLLDGSTSYSADVFGVRAQVDF